MTVDTLEVDCHHNTPYLVAAVVGSLAADPAGTCPGWGRAAPAGIQGSWAAVAGMLVEDRTLQQLCYPSNKIQSN